MKKQFTAQDCIHLYACRRVNKIANNYLYGRLGTQKVSRGCNEDCPCYCKYDDEEGVQELCESVAKWSDKSERAKKYCITLAKNRKKKQEESETEEQEDIMEFIMQNF